MIKPSLMTNSAQRFEWYTPCKGKHDNMTHARSRRPHMWQQFVVMIKEMIRSYLTLVHVFHVIPLRAIRGWPKHYPNIHPGGMVA
jgi:hypothetical protein